MDFIEIQSTSSIIVAFELRNENDTETDAIVSSYVLTASFIDNCIIQGIILYQQIYYSIQEIICHQIVIIIIKTHRLLIVYFALL